MISEDMATIAGIATYFIVLLFILKINRRLDIMGTSRKPLLEAQRLGHVVTGYCIPESIRVTTRDPGKATERRCYRAHYRYEVNGISYQKKNIWTIGKPYPTLTLYYTEDPACAFQEGENTGSRFRIVTPIIALLISFFAAFLVYSSLC